MRSEVGVVSDYHFQSLNQEIAPELFSVRGPDGFGMTYIKIKPNSETASLLNLEKVFKYLFPLVQCDAIWGMTGRPALTKSNLEEAKPFFNNQIK